MPPHFAAYQSPNVTGYDYSPEKAMSLLDEAGYTDIDGDGFSENPDGSPLVIKWAVPNNNPETVVMYKLQCWNDIGLDVRLLTGTLMDVNAYYDMLFADAPEIDMFEFGWVVEESPNLQDAWGRFAIPNFTRFASEEMDELLAALDSEEAWDRDYRVEAYHRFTEYFFEQSTAIPTIWRTNLYAVNNRVRNYTGFPVQNAIERHLIEIIKQ
jgi:peptide/nickel transport system substrate-binding protein